MDYKHFKIFFNENEYGNCCEPMEYRWYVTDDFRVESWDYCGARTEFNGRDLPDVMNYLRDNYKSPAPMKTQLDVTNYLCEKKIFGIERVQAQRFGLLTLDLLSKYGLMLGLLSFHKNGFSILRYYDDWDHVLYKDLYGAFL